MGAMKTISCNENKGVESLKYYGEVLKNVFFLNFKNYLKYLQVANIHYTSCTYKMPTKYFRIWTPQCHNIHKMTLFLHSIRTYIKAFFTIDNFCNNLFVNNAYPYNNLPVSNNTLDHIATLEFYVFLH